MSRMPKKRIMLYSTLIYGLPATSVIAWLIILRWNKKTVDTPNPPSGGGTVSRGGRGRYCSGCGAPVTGGRFCSGCGASL